ncbi:MAG: hypothetical protein QF735_08765, partial [Phycisphaeraceae bacterium]|nr:hypothetical protein [Phycisphaeraceae bacterium]
MLIVPLVQRERSLGDMDVDSAGIVCQASVAQDAAYPRAKRIHDSWITQEAVKTLAGRIVLHLRAP